MTAENRKINAFLAVETLIPLLIACSRAVSSARNTRTPATLAQSPAHTHTGTRRGAIGFPAEMRASYVGGGSGRWSLGVPGAVFGRQHFPMLPLTL